MVYENRKHFAEKFSCFERSIGFQRLLFLWNKDFWWILSATQAGYDINPKTIHRKSVFGTTIVEIWYFFECFKNVFNSSGKEIIRTQESEEKVNQKIGKKSCGFLIYQRRWAEDLKLRKMWRFMWMFPHRSFLWASWTENLYEKICWKFAVS